MRKDGIKTGVARKPRDKGTPGVARPQLVAGAGTERENLLPPNRRPV